MTERARDARPDQLGLRQFLGLAAPTHRMSMRDLGVLAARLITEFPQYYGYFAMEEFPSTAARRRTASTAIRCSASGSAPTG
jgi:D-alanyl-D-alanine carboxypeptidase